ncbi:MAG TPA: squalene/phytoene synthase family protein [Acetobacteraceae bacterium]|nr:squalene/phytoene synthase family protein [Acetobacteraceae bacterium]
MKPGAGLSAAGALVRRNDPDRFLAALFAPASARETLFVLYAFNIELARACEVAREPHASLIRLAWWREVVEGAERRHEVATPLAAALADGRLDPAALLALIDARESEVVPEFATLADWRAHLIAGQGGLAVAAGKVLGVEAAPALCGFGAAYGAARLLGSVPALARRGRALLPADILAAHGLSAEAVVASPDAPALAAVRGQLAGEAAAWLAEARRAKLPRAGLPAALPAVLAARDLRRPGEVPLPRGLGARLAVLMAALRGRV